MKICIIGYSGSGKSTTCKTLAQYYSLPYLHLDKELNAFLDSEKRYCN